jgi:hypothetical protein
MIGGLCSAAGNVTRISYFFISFCTSVFSILYPPPDFQF